MPVEKCPFLDLDYGYLAEEPNNPLCLGNPIHSDPFTWTAPINWPSLPWCRPTQSVNIGDWDRLAVQQVWKMAHCNIADLAQAPTVTRTLIYITEGSESRRFRIESPSTIPGHNFTELFAVGRGVTCRNMFVCMKQVPPKVVKLGAQTIKNGVLIDVTLTTLAGETTVIKNVKFFFKLLDLAHLAQGAFNDKRTPVQFLRLSGEYIPLHEYFKLSVLETCCDARTDRDTTSVPPTPASVESFSDRQSPPSTRSYRSTVRGASTSSWGSPSGPSSPASQRSHVFNQ